MHSAFRTLLYFAGVLAVCYIIQAASWVQVLLLFSSAGIGWCLFTLLLPRQQGFAPRARFTATKLDDETIRQQAEQQNANAMPSTVNDVAMPELQMSNPTGYSYRFPIHKLSSRPMML